MRSHGSTPIRSARSLALSPLALLCIAGAASAQVTFSIDYRSPSIAFGLSPADILGPALGAPAFGPLPPPIIIIPGGPAGVAGLGLPSYAPCAGAPPGAMCPREVDAFSRGVDFPVRPMTHAGQFVFSVDEFATGLPGSPLAPSVLSEAPFGDVAADIFEDRGLPPGPLPPILGGSPGNTGIIDGNGLPSGSGAVYPGVGLIEPNFPVPPLAIDGDNIDALDIADAPMPPAGVFFSLDAAFLDPARGIPNTGSAAANGFLPGAVLQTLAPGGPIIVYAAPAALGLDLMGPGTDDLDALALFENGIPGYQPSPGPYLWGPGSPFDMLLFSVRRGSAVIGVPDSMFGMPIMPGDILIPPPAPGLPPGIFIAAEWLGLNTTRATGAPFGGDDLDALDTRWLPQTATSYCFGTAATCPCGNAGMPGNGCANSVIAAGANLSASGVASVAADSVLLIGTNMPNGPCLYFQGTSQVMAPFGDGKKCVGGPGIIRLAIKFNAGNMSSFPVGADPKVSVKGAIPAAGGTRFYQIWHRDAGAFCTPSTFNLSNGIGIVWTP